jgi:phosphoglycolate phosphatase
VLAQTQFPLPVRVVIIDLDGTLLDTAADLACAANLMRRDLGLAPVPEALIKTFVGLGIAHLIRRTVGAGTEREAQPELLAAAAAAFERHYARVLTRSSRPFPGVIEGLRAMQDAGLQLACVTNKAERFTLPLLQHTKLAPFFELVVCGDSLAKKKPDPLPLLHAARHFGAASHEVVLIGDSPYDSQAARAAGCHVFIVTYGYRGDASANTLDADALLATLVEAADLIENSAHQPAAHAPT